MTDTITLTFTGTEFTPYNNEANEGVIGTGLSINWGDGNTETVTSTTKLPSHTYSEEGTYTILITGTTITTLGTYCFSRITGLINIKIPNSVTTIKQHCFNRCSTITNIIIPNSVTSIGSACFYNCTNLNNITLESNTPQQ